MKITIHTTEHTNVVRRQWRVLAGLGMADCVALRHSTLTARTKG